MATGSNYNPDVLKSGEKYYENCSEQVREAIKDRIVILDHQTILLNDLQVNTPYTLEILLNEVSRKGRSLGRYSLIIDGRKSVLPDGKNRKKINEMFSLMSEELSHVSFCTGRKLVLNTAAKFIIYRTKLKSYSFNSTLEEAKECVKKAMSA